MPSLALFLHFTEKAYGAELMDLMAYDSKATTSRHRVLTLDYLGFRPFNTHARQDIAREIRMMVRSRMRPKAILLRVLEILEGRKTEIPTARTLISIDHASPAPIGVHTTSLQKISLTYYTQNLRQQARRVSLLQTIDLHREFVEKAQYSFLDLITKTDWTFLHRQIMRVLRYTRLITGRFRVLQAK
jgi:hypothetical protein